MVGWVRPDQELQRDALAGAGRVVKPVACVIRAGNAQTPHGAASRRTLGLNIKTFRGWRARPDSVRAATVRPSKLDPFKGRIVGWLDAHPISAQQVSQRLREAGYGEA